MVTMTKEPQNFCEIYNIYGNSIFWELLLFINSKISKSEK